MAGCCPPSSYIRRFLLPTESQNVRAHCQNVILVRDVAKNGLIGIPKRIFWVTGTQLLETHKTGTVPGTWGRMGTPTLHDRQKYSHRLFIRSETPVLLMPVGIQFNAGSFTLCTPVTTLVTSNNILLSPSLLAVLFSMHDTRNVLRSTRHVSRCFRYSLHCCKLIVRCYQPAFATMQLSSMQFAYVSGTVRASWLYKNNNRNFS